MNDLTEYDTEKPAKKHNLTHPRHKSFRTDDHSSAVEGTRSGLTTEFASYKVPHRTDLIPGRFEQTSFQGMKDFMQRSIALRRAAKQPRDDLVVGYESRLPKIDGDVSNEKFLDRIRNWIF